MYNNFCLFPPDKEGMAKLNSTCSQTAMFLRMLEGANLPKFYDRERQNLIQGLLDLQRKVHRLDAISLSHVSANAEPSLKETTGKNVHVYNWYYTYNQSWLFRIHDLANIAYIIIFFYLTFWYTQHALAYKCSALEKKKPLIRMCIYIIYIYVQRR